MAPDFTSFVLDILYDEWGTGDDPAPPRPVIIDRRNTTRMGAREPDARANLSAHNVIGVGAAPQTDNTALGFEYDYRYDGGADVRIRGKDATEGGHIAGIRGPSGWNALTGETRRIINAHRRHPIEQDGYAGAYTLRTDHYNDMSQNFAEEYWAQFDVLFRGIEVLP